MSSCKDCVHYEVCKIFSNGRKENIDAYKDVDVFCRSFKPKSRFVELPCEVGQTVWLKMHGVITEGTIIMIDLNYYTNPQVWLSVEYISPITGNKNEYKSRADLMLGKTVFLSENALKEREKE